MSIVERGVLLVLKDCRCQSSARSYFNVSNESEIFPSSTKPLGKFEFGRSTYNQYLVVLIVQLMNISELNSSFQR